MQSLNLLSLYGYAVHCRAWEKKTKKKKKKKNRLFWDRDKESQQATFRVPYSVEHRSKCIFSTAWLSTFLNLA